MTFISINLLPEEVILEQTKKIKFVKIQVISIVLLLLTFFLASLTIALRVLQTQRITQVQGKLTEVEGKISGYKGLEDNIVLLKNRVASISQYLGVPSRSSQIYDFIEQNIPPQVSINSLTIDKEGNSYLALILSDTSTMDSIISGLFEASNDKIKIEQVDVGGISRGRDGIYRLTLKLKTGK